MKKLTKTLLASAAALLSMNAMAGSQSFDSTFFDVEGNGGGALTLPKFDGSLGVLTSVDVVLEDRLSGFLQVQNNGTVPYTFTSSMTGVLNVTGTPITLSTTGSHDFVNLPAGANNTYDIGTVTDTFSHSYSGPLLAALYGPGSITVNVDGSVTPNFGGPANVDFYSEGTIDAYAKITYNYTTAPVPEPETYAMLLAGLGLLGFIARKRKAS